MLQNWDSKILKEVIQEGPSDYSRYREDPVGFVETVLGETLTDDLKSILESVRDNETTIAKSCNAPGKTFIASSCAVWFYKSHPGARVYTAAAPPEKNLRDLLWGEINSKVQDHPDLFKDDNVLSMDIKRAPKEFITGVTIPAAGTSSVRESSFSGKHAPNLLFILDEADAIPDEVYKGIESCGSGGKFRKLILFNPRAEVGPVYRMERSNEANIITLSAFNHPNVVSGKDVIPGAVTRARTIIRINEWCRLKDPDEDSNDTFELPGYLVGATTKKQKGTDLYQPLQAGEYVINNPQFSYMVLGRYPAQSEYQLISREWVNNARARWDSYTAVNGEKPPAGTTGVAGLDVAAEGQDSNVFTARYGGYVERPVSWSGVDTVKTGERAFLEFNQRNLSMVNVDATGVGAGVAPYIRKLGGSAVPVMVASAPTEKTEEGEFRILRDQLCWRMREWLRTDPGAMLPPDEELVEELLTPTYDPASGKIEVMPTAVRQDDERGRGKTMKSLLKRSPDKFMSLMLTFYTTDLIFPELI